MLTAQDILKKFYGFEAFKGLQESIINSVLAKKDTLGLMPTGGGKSLCFQIPALLQDGICLVISPLTALMKDQIDDLRKKDIKAMALMGSLTTQEVSDLLDNALYGGYKFLYIAPERLQQTWVLERITALPINLIAIDEAHCVSQWGHDFRPAYLQINKIRICLPQVPFLALTASATADIKEDIIKLLHLKDPQVFQNSFERKNISYRVIETQDKYYHIEKIFKERPAPTIIYVRNRRTCIEVSNNLMTIGIKTTFFHGGLSLSDKEKNMNLWMSEQTPIIVATSAFGMGINKPNVRNVIHIQLPENLESYYQEAGRAGRDGLPSQAVILLNPHDISAARQQFIEVLPDKDFLKNVYIRLCNFFQIAYGEAPETVFQFNFGQFCTQYQLSVPKTYNALLFLDQQSVITLSQEFSKKVSLQFLISGKEIVRYISLNPNDGEILSNILRTYSGIFDINTPIQIPLIAKKSRVETSKVIRLLERLQQLGMIDYRAQNNDATIIFNEIREDQYTINRIAKHLISQNELKTTRLESVIRFVSNTRTCKSLLLLQYFGEQDLKECGHCSVCTSKQKTSISPEETSLKILTLLDQNPLTSRELEQKLSLPQNHIIQIIRQLLEDNQITINSRNQYVRA